MGIGKAYKVDPEEAINTTAKRERLDTAPGDPYYSSRPKTKAEYQAEAGYKEGFHKEHQDYYKGIESVRNRKSKNRKDDE